MLGVTDLWWCRDAGDRLIWCVIETHIGRFLPRDHVLHRAWVLPVQWLAARSGKLVTLFQCTTWVELQGKIQNQWERKGREGPRARTSGVCRCATAAQAPARFLLGTVWCHLTGPTTCIIPWLVSSLFTVFISLKFSQNASSHRTSAG
jgi:hypothetical protein